MPLYSGNALKLNQLVLLRNRYVYRAVLGIMRNSNQKAKLDKSKQALNNGKWKRPALKNQMTWFQFGSQH